MAALAPEARREAAAAAAQVRALISQLEPPDFWAYLAHVQIESDDPDAPGPLAFDPWPLQRERFESWLTGTSEVWLKRRQIGASWCEAAYAWWVAAYHPAWHVAVFSQGQDYAAEFLRKVRFVGDHLPAQLRRPYVGKERVEFSGSGSLIIGFPSTESAGISYTFRLVIADEAAFHPYGRQNYTAYRPAIDAGGQYLCSSTADPRLGPSGFFHDLYNDAVAGRNGYHAVFTGRWARPGQGADWWADVQRSYAGMDQERDAYYPESDTQAFVGKAGLVYPQWSLERHGMHGDPVRWEECISRHACYDLGGGDPTAVVVLGVYRRRDGQRAVHQFGEMYKPTGAPTVEEIGGYLLRWQDRARFQAVEPDPVGATSTVAASLYAMGLPVRGELNDKGLFTPTPLTRDPGERRGIHAMYLELGLLTINVDACPYSVREFAGYRWRETVDPNSKDRYRIATPVDHHGDAMAAREGALVAVYYDEMSRGNGRQRPKRVQTGRRMTEGVRA